MSLPPLEEGGRGPDEGKVDAAALEKGNREKPPLISRLRAAASPEGRSLLERAFPREGEGGRGSDRGRMRGDVSAAAPYMDNRDNAAPRQPPAGGSFSRREKPLCKEMKKMIDKNRLATKCSTWNIELTGTQLDLLDKYAALLVSYNEKVNLTAITSPEGIEDRHFADSLLFAAQPEVQGKLVDVGTGAGFPGIVAKIYKPDLQLTLMEPTGKRVDFLKYACAELGLTGVEFAKERAEEAARKIWREQFDVASARAVAALPVLSEYCLPLVKIGGSFIAMKGPEADAEAKAAANALKKLGGQYEETRQFTLPDGSARGLVFCRKISQTPTVYPRNGGKIAKKPL